jgi:uncharacterized protein VirK/YbjX
LQSLPYRPVAIFLQPSYLARTLTAPERLACHFHNTAYLCERFAPSALLALYGEGVELFSRAEGEVAASCRLAANRKASNQGELSLKLVLGDQEIYALDFSFVPGAIFRAEEPTVPLIARMQGVAQSFEDIRLATRMFRDIAPQAVLFAALQGVAERLGIRHILGAPARFQPSYSERNAKALTRNYDEFFAAVGAARENGGFYVYDRALFVDILDHMPAKHRARTKAKRRLKAALAAGASDALAARVLPALAPRWRRIGQFMAEHFSTRVGERRAGALATTGRPGFLLFGPYAYLAAGDYEAAFLLEDVAQGGDFVIDVMAERGQTRVAHKTVAAGETPALAFSLAQALDDVEFRLIATAESAFVVRGVELRARVLAVQPQ